MKTFREFIFECNKSLINTLFSLYEGKYSDEQAFAKIWNHFITHKKYGVELKNILRSKDFNGAREYMENEIENARNDSNHPLSFDKAKRGFQGGKTPDDVDSYYDMMKLAPDSVTAFIKGRRGSNTAERIATYARVSGTKKAPTSSEWKNETGKSVDTSKRDIEFVDPKNKKYGLGLSLKMGKGSQTISAEPSEIYANLQAAGKEYIIKLKKQGASEEQINSFKMQLDKTSELVAKSLGFTSPQMTPKVNKELSDRRLSVSQKSIDKLFNNHPNFISDVNKEGSGGEKKFGRGVSSFPDQQSVEVRAAQEALRIRRGEIDLIKNRRGKFSFSSSDFKKNKNDSEEDAQFKKLVRIFSNNRNKLMTALNSSPSGKAQEVVTGTNIDNDGSVIARAKTVELSQIGRTTPKTGLSASAPKGMTKDPNISRPGNVKLRVYGSEEPISRQSTFSSFSKEAAKAQLALRQAEKEKEEAKTIIGPDGNKVLRQHAANFLKNNPDKAQQRSLKISTAQQNIDASTANINSIQQQKAESQAASTPSQPTQTPLSTQPQQIQTPPSQPTQTPLPIQPQQIQTPPPEQQQAPPQEQVPPTEQQQVPPPEQKPKKKRKLEPENVEQTTEPVA